MHKLQCVKIKQNSAKIQDLENLSQHAGDYTKSTTFVSFSTYMKVPTLSFWQIWNMNVGFLGIQFSFGLQQNAIIPIWTFLGVHPEDLPYLSLAAPMTGLFVQPIIGALSDRTWSPRWGRRKPFFLIGAVVGSLCLFFMPYSKVLWVSVCLLWLLDLANNTAMEPYRAFVADKVNDQQKPLAYLTQSFFTGLGITLASSSLWVFKQLITGNADWNIPYWIFASFTLGAGISICSMLWSTFTTSELPPTPEQLQHIAASKGNPMAHLFEIFSAIKGMPRILWQVALVYLFQWYAMFCYWQYCSYSIAKSIWGVTKDFHTDPAYQDAATWSALMNGFYNAVTLCTAFLLVKVAKKYNATHTHTICLLLGGTALIIIPQIHQPFLLLLPMIGFGIAWASMMGVPYIFIVPSLPRERYGIYMAIVYMMAVIPMIIQSLSFSLIYEHLLGKNPNLAIAFAGVCLLIAGLLTLRIKPATKPATL